MQARPTVTERERTVTETVRRTQIVEATIRTLAQLGYAKTSYSQIAQRAGLSSTGLISYHFTSKGELMGEVVSAVISGIGRHVHERMERTTSPDEALRAYILATIEYIGGHREEMAALLAVAMSGALGAGVADTGRAADAVEEILLDGQRTGQFRAFDSGVVASVIQRSIEVVPVMLAADLNFDLAGYGRELATLFDRATRRGAED